MQVGEVLDGSWRRRSPRRRRCGRSGNVGRGGNGAGGSVDGSVDGVGVGGGGGRGVAREGGGHVGSGGGEGDEQRLQEERAEVGGAARGARGSALSSVDLTPSSPMYFAARCSALFSLYYTPSHTLLSKIERKIELENTPLFHKVGHIAFYYL